MKTTLKRNERLVRAGHTALRTLSGKPCVNMPQYLILPESEADPAAVVPLRRNERLEVIGVVCTGLSSAKERYAAALRGERVKPKADGMRIYIKTDKSAADPDTVFSDGEKAVLDDFAAALLPVFRQHMETDGERHD